MALILEKDGKMRETGCLTLTLYDCLPLVNPC
jgi:hypothetical protein